MSDNNATDNSAVVKVFSADWCGFCRMVKAYLTSKEVEFEVVDIDKDPAKADELREMTGQAGIPVTLFGDKEFVIGFDRGRIDEMLREYDLA